MAVLACGVVVGCGSSRKSAAPSPALQTLSYFPSTAPFVLTVQTDPNAAGFKNARALEQRFPQAALLQTALFVRLGQLGIDYNKQIRPLFGNPFAFGVLSSRSSGSQTPVMAAWVTKSPSALAALVKKLGPMVTSTSSHDGAKLYITSGATLAIDGPTVVIAQTTQDIDAALDRHRSGQGISAAQYARLSAGLSSGSLMQMFGDVTQALSVPQAAEAQRIPWVAAIRGYGASVGATPTAMTVRFHLDTSARSLSPSQLPLASGSAAPGVATSAPIQMGLRGLNQSIQFAESAAQAANPGQYATFTKRVATLKRRAGFDLNAFVAMLTGTFDLSSDTKTTIARVGVSNPSSVAAMLAKLSAAPSLAFRKGARLRPLGGGFYELQEVDGPRLTIGVTAGQLVLGKATRTQIRTFANAPQSTVSGATGAVVFRVALQELLRLTLKQAPSPLAQQLLARLGELTGSVSATASGLDGTATLALK